MERVILVLSAFVIDRSGRHGNPLAKSRPANRYVVCPPCLGSRRQCNHVTWRCSRHSNLDRCIVALGGVRADECSHASFTVQYEKCHMNYTEAIYTKVSPRDVSHCMGVSNDLINCLKTLLDRCKDNSDLKWFQLSYSSGHIQKAAKYVCNHMDEIKALVNCAINPGGYAKCVGDATQGSADFCTRLNALLACMTQFYEKCTATQREVAKNLFFMSHPGDCSKSQGTKTGVGLALLALPSFILLYALT